MEISTPRDIAVGTHFHARSGTKTILVFLPTDGEASCIRTQKIVFIAFIGQEQVIYRLITYIKKTTRAKLSQFAIYIEGITYLLW